MKRVLSIFTVLILLFITSCGTEPNACAMLEEFLAIYSAEGVVYSPSIPEGEHGSLREDTFEKIYVYRGEMPKNCAIFLSSHIDTASECGVFVCQSDTELIAITEACRERMRLLAGEGGGIIISSGSIVFYSTMSEPSVVEACWRRVLSSMA